MTDRIIAQARELGREVQERFAVDQIYAEAQYWHRAYQIVSMGLAVSVVVNIVVIFWR